MKKNCIRSFDLLVTSEDVISAVADYNKAVDEGKNRFARVTSCIVAQAVRRTLPNEELFSCGSAVVLGGNNERAHTEYVAEVGGQYVQSIQSRFDSMTGPPHSEKLSFAAVMDEVADFLYKRIVYTRSDVRE